MSEARVTTQGRVTVPRDVRTRLGLKPGDRLDFSVAADGTVTVRREGPAAARGRSEDDDRSRARRLGHVTR